jgi:predicted transcriptional regulator
MLLARVLVLLLLASAPASSGYVVAFQDPGQLDHAVVKTGSWLLLTWEANAPNVTIQLPTGGTWRSESVVVVDSNVPLAALTPAPAQGPNSQPRNVSNGTVITLRPARPDGFLYLEASQIAAHATASMNLQVKDAGEALSRERPHLPGIAPQGVTVLTAPDQPFAHSLRFEADGLSLAKWHGAEVECTTQGQTCPAGGEHRVISDGQPYGARVESFSFEILELSGGTAGGAGRVDAFVVGAPRLDVRVNGSVRLPLASGNPDCTQCLSPENQTFAAFGDILLAGLAPTADRRLSANISGDIRAARFDEVAVDPASLGISPAPAAATAVAIVGGLLILKFFAGALFTRMSPEKALEHPRRQAIFEQVRHNPGINFRQVVRATGIAAGTVRHHLTILERAGHVIEKAHGSTIRLFENHGKFNETWSRIVLLREPELALLHTWLEQHGPAFQKDVLDAMSRHGWSRSTTQHRLGRLVRGGAVSIRQQGRWKSYSLVPVAAPPPQRLFGSVRPPGVQARTGPAPSA